MCLKLIKSGEIVASANLKAYFMFAAKQVKLINDASFDGAGKKLASLKNDLDKWVLRNNVTDKK